MGGNLVPQQEKLKTGPWLTDTARGFTPDIINLSAVYRGFKNGHFVMDFWASKLLLPLCYHRDQQYCVGHETEPFMNSKLRSILLFVGLWLAATVQAWPATSANSPFSVDVWDSEDGLPQNSIISMTQTRDGFLWLGTLDGLVRFDGQRSQRFLVLDESNTPGLKSSRIVYLFEDSARRLWIGTENAGIAVMENGKVTSPPELSQEGAFRRLSAACEDREGNVWLYCANGELWRYANGRYSAFYYNQGANVSRPLVVEKAGPVLIGTDWTLCSIGQVFSGSALSLPCAEEFSVTNLNYLLPSQRGGHWRLVNGRIQKWTTNHLDFDLGPYPWNSVSNRISTACEDRQGNLIVGTLGAGVFWFGADGKFSNLSTNENLANNFILSLVTDQEGTLWVGTDGGGLNRVKKKMFATVDGTQGRVVRTVAEDKNGGVWIGYNGGGMDYSKDARIQFSAASPLNSPVHTMFVDSSNRIWAGFFSMGLYQFQRDGFRPAPGYQFLSREVSSIFEDRLGRVWAGTPTGLSLWQDNHWQLFSTRDGLSSDNVRTIVDDSQGNIWIGTMGGGLNRLHEGRFNSYQKKDGLPSDDITFLYVDKQDVVWIATYGGLGRFSDGKFTSYGMSDGLLSNRIRYLLEDDQENLWLGSNFGLMRIPKKSLNDFARGSTASLNIRSYRQREGLPISECSSGSQPGPCKTRDGKLWFPTIKGLAYVNPAELSINSNPPPVIIESVLVEGQENADVALAQKLEIPAGKERLDIHFTSLNLSAPEQARFRYQLEGHETAWIDAGNSRVARYSKLPPGHYKFQVTACNEDGIWNRVGSSFAFIVEPPFYQTWWFLCLTTVALLGSVAGGVHYVSTQKLQRQLASMRQQEALEKERARIARDIHDQLGANLTQVALLGELVEADKDSPKDVEEYGQQISQSARDVSRVLDEIVWTVNPQNDTLEGLVNYVCKYAQEYLAVADLRYRLEVPPAVPPLNISPEVRHNVFLASKEAITNIVKHAKATGVTLRLKLESGTFSFEIEDDGVGLAGMDKERAKTRNGLRNQRKRMEDIGGSFTISPGAEGGTMVRLTAPSRNSDTI
jgi:ligand-binding sensor domain-containing protein/signal transduction histidine kinase